jgi:hypothetical protein
MAGLGTLVEARVSAHPTIDGALTPAVPDGFTPKLRYEGPGGPLVAAHDDDLRATWVGGPGADGLLLPWGDLDSLDEPGTYRRLADGVRSSIAERAHTLLTVRLVGTSLRTSGRWLEIRVTGGPRYELRQRAVRGVRLERDGRLVAKGLRRDAVEVAADATSVDATLVTAYKASLWRMLRLPSISLGEIPGD